LIEEERTEGQEPTPDEQGEPEEGQAAPADEAPQPEPDEPAAEAPVAEEPPAEEQAAEEPTAEQPVAEETPTEEPAPEGEAPGPERDRAPAREGRKADEPPPGAELEPIAIEPGRELTAEERARLDAEAEERARREAEATAERTDEPAPRGEPISEIPAETRIQATGKRKNSIARVIVSSGEGRFEVNRRGLEEYFPRQHHRAIVRQALVATGFEGSVNVQARVHGGGVSGQAGAIRHGVARALTEIDSELRRDLKRRGLLTRDARRKERRKAGLKKARKRPQFSKR
jgi:small subunit ribosomal protein S9